MDTIIYWFHSQDIFTSHHGMSDRNQITKGNKTNDLGQVTDKLSPGQVLNVTDACM